VKNVLSGLKRSEFYNPGSIVRLSVKANDPLSRGLADEVPAYFITSSAFDIDQASADSANSNVKNSRIVARYAEKDALLSGWMLGEKYLSGKAALVAMDYGKGKLILFGFRPQHRGQTWGTFPFIFNSLEK